jgi:hypothetical protein
MSNDLSSALTGKTERGALGAEGFGAVQFGCLKADILAFAGAMVGPTPTTWVAHRRVWNAALGCRYWITVGLMMDGNLGSTVMALVKCLGMIEGWGD